MRTWRTRRQPWTDNNLIERPKVQIIFATASASSPPWYCWNRCFHAKYVCLSCSYPRVAQVTIGMVSATWRLQCNFQYVFGIVSENVWSTYIKVRKKNQVESWIPKLLSISWHVFLGFRFCSNANRHSGEQFCWGWSNHRCRVEASLWLFQIFCQY